MINLRLTSLLSAYLWCGQIIDVTRNTKNLKSFVVLRHEMFWGTILRVCPHSQQRRAKLSINQSNGRDNQSQFRSGETHQLHRCRATCVLTRVTLGTRMSCELNYPPYLRAQTPTHTQPCHKACDVAYSPGMKGQTLHSKADGADLPGGSVPVPKAQLWPDSAEEAPGMERLLRKCRIRSKLLRECLAECLGVYVLIVSLQYYYYYYY